MVPDDAYYEFADEFSKFNMADRIRRTKVEKYRNLNANWELRFFGVTYCESSFIILKFKIADPFWRKKIKVTQC